MAGYIKLYRGSRDTDGIRASEHFSEWEAWTWLLENAAWKAITRRNSKGEEIALEAGQIHVSVRSLSTAWGWSRKAVCTFLDRLEKVRKVERKGGQSGTVLSICNWAKYQGQDVDKGDSRGTAGGQPGDTQEEGKELKEENNNGAYAFSGRVIRLNELDFARWKKAYSLIDIRAALQGRDDWLSDRPEAERKRWFQSTSSWLANKQQEAARQDKKAAECVFDMPC